MNQYSTSGQEPPPNKTMYGNSERTKKGIYLFRLRDTLRLLRVDRSDSEGRGCSGWSELEADHRLQEEEREVCLDCAETEDRVVARPNAWGKRSSEE